MKLKLNDIITDAGTQMRARIDDDTVDDYMQVKNLPPVVVFRDSVGNQYLSDGFHRFESAVRAKKKTIDAEVRDGELRDAILHAVGANAIHGLRRTNEDKRRAVETLLNDGEWSQMSNRSIADRCSVHHKFVSKIRSEVATVATCNEKNEGAEVVTVTTSEGETVGPETRTGKDGKQYPAKKNPKSVSKKADHDDGDSSPKISGGTTFNVDEFADNEPDPQVVAAQLAFDRAKQTKQAYAALRREFTGLHKDLKQFSETDDGEPLLKHEQSFQTHVQAITGYIKSEQPHCVCFVCDGDGCDSCESLGYMTKRRHDSRVPEDQSAVVYV